MKIFRWVAICIIAVILAIISFLSYMGYFNKLKVEEKIIGPYTGVYESFIGDYMATGKIFDKLYNELKKDNILTYKSFGIYYDDPAKVPKNQLHSDCGIILEEKDMTKVKDIEKKYKIKKLDQKMSLVAEFPIKNGLSFMFGPMKAYPKLMKYAKEKKYNVSLSYEIYDMQLKKIYYVMPF